MKRIAYGLCVAGLAAALSAPAFATSSSFESKKVQIPFPFKVARTQMPAGEYRIQEGISKRVLVLTNRKTGESVHFVRSAYRDDYKHLVFHVKGEGYVLTEVR